MTLIDCLYTGLNKSKDPVQISRAQWVGGARAHVTYQYKSPLSGALQLFFWGQANSQQIHFQNSFITYLIWFSEESWGRQERHFCHSRIIDGETETQTGWLTGPQSPVAEPGPGEAFQSPLPHVQAICEGLWRRWDYLTNDTSNTLGHLQVLNSAAPFQFWSLCALTALAPKEPRMWQDGSSWWAGEQAWLLLGWPVLVQNKANLPCLRSLNPCTG